jgi:hypothetical protein
MAPVGYKVSLFFSNRSQLSVLCRKKAAMPCCLICNFFSDLPAVVSRHKHENHTVPDPVDVNGKQVIIVRSPVDNLLECPVSDCDYKAQTRSACSRHLKGHDLSTFKRSLPDGNNVLSSPPKKLKKTDGTCRRYPRAWCATADHASSEVPEDPPGVVHQSKRSQVILHILLFLWLVR